MFVLRRTRLVRKDRNTEVAEWAAQGAQQMAPHGYRVYTSGISPRDTVVMEIEFESWDEIRSFLDNAHNAITDPELRSWWAESGVPGGTDEIWNVFASRD